MGRSFGIVPGDDSGGDFGENAFGRFPGDDSG